MARKKKAVKETRRGVDLKIVMVGDASIGKTCMVLRYTEREFKENISTIGASFVLKDWGNYCIAIWDTAGEEKYAGLTTFYYRNASAAILAFDMFDRFTYHKLMGRYIPILNNASSPELKVVVATKSDLIGQRQREVTYREGIELAKALNPKMDFNEDKFVPFFETSSVTGQNIDEAFEYVFNFFFPGGRARPTPVPEFTDSIQLHDRSRRSLKNRCC